jgi:hypothetical protein
MHKNYQFVCLTSYLNTEWESNVSYFEGIIYLLEAKI